MKVVSVFFSFLKKSYLSLSTRIFCDFNVIAFLNLVFICILVFAIVSRYHLDLCRNVFGEGVFPDVFMTNLYYGGTGIAGMAFESSELFASVLELS
jgi:dolichyl-phosphate-mannose--protein O-mannosyl transferase